MIADNPKLLQLLPRFGIQLGFGDRNVEEVCKMNQVSTKLFLLVCSIHFDPDTLPRDIEPDSADWDSLLAYLNASHRFYLDDRFPHIEEHLGRIIEAAGPKYGNMLQHFYGEYKHEMVKHFQYEEEVVFPYIEALLKGQKTSYSIDQFRHNHSNIEDALEDMTNILIKYLPGDILPDERICIATDIMEVSADLVSHSLIEDRILVPFVESLENAKP
jgi:regulator of cell morphogenesis and NO signaling